MGVQTIKKNTRSPLTYADRIDMLRQRKLQQTAEKAAVFGPMDEDDYGTVVPPADWKWRIRANHPNGSFYGPKGWGDNFCSLMESCPVYVDPVAALTGRCFGFLSRLRAQQGGGIPHPDYDCPHLREEQTRYCIYSGIWSDTHFAGDCRIGLSLGWGGLLNKVRQFRARNVAGAPAAARRELEEFYQAHEDVILGTQNWIGRTLAALADAEEVEPRAQLRENLRELTEVHRRVIDQPPRTFHEVCQWLAHFNVASRMFNRDGAGHQLDELLRPYYEADIAAGRLDDEKAIFILACLFLADTRYYQIAGPGPDGRDLTTRMTYLIIEAAHRLGVPVNLTVRVHGGLDRALFLKTVEHLCRDRKGWPRYCGDKALNEGFARNGYPMELARQRLAVGCHWTAIPGREYTMNDTVKINVAKVFEVAFQEMMGPGAEGVCDRKAPSVTGLWELFEAHLRRAVLCTKRGIDWHLDHVGRLQPELMLNLVCYGPIEKGRDVTDGGVEFYNMCMDGSGLTTVADSFAALEQRIERDGVVSWPEIAQHLRDNFSGPDGPRVRQWMRSSERFGQGGSLGDAWAARVSQLFTALVKESPTPGGRNCIPGWFTWSNTIQLGRAVGATPNGRLAGAPISHGANPDPGFRKDAAPTALSCAVAAVQCGYGNTAPMQLELDPGLARGDDGVANVAALIEGHFRQGGTLLNINIIDADQVLAAHEDPSAYPDLVVRVTGFTAYFAVLSPEFRQLVVERMIREGVSGLGVTRAAQRSSGGQATVKETGK
jgi:formate C-acetyltransferase